MVSGTVRKATAIAGALTFAGGGAVIAYAQRTNEPPCTPHAGAGGLALCAPNEADKSITVTRSAQAGSADKLFVMNNSRVRARRDGQGTSMDPGRERGRDAEPPRDARRGVTVSEEVVHARARRAQGTSRSRSNGVPASGYLYGALEVVGLPAGSRGSARAS